MRGNTPLTHFTKMNHVLSCAKLVRRSPKESEGVRRSFAIPTELLLAIALERLIHLASVLAKLLQTIFAPTQCKIPFPALLLSFGLALSPVPFLQSALRLVQISSAKLVLCKPKGIRDLRALQTRGLLALHWKGLHLLAFSVLLLLEYVPFLRRRIGYSAFPQ